MSAPQPEGPASAAGRPRRRGQADADARDVTGLSPQLRLRVLAVLVVGLTLGLAALSRVTAGGLPGPLSEDAVADVARRLPPGPALVLGRRLPLDAPAEAWAQIPGVGPKTAAALVSAAPRAPSELARIRGIGPHRARRLAGWVRAAH